MRVRKLATIFLTEKEMDEALALWLRHNGKEPLADHLELNSHSLEWDWDEQAWCLSLDSYLKEDDDE